MVQAGVERLDYVHSSRLHSTAILVCPTSAGYVPGLEVGQAQDPAVCTSGRSWNACRRRNSKVVCTNP